MRLGFGTWVSAVPTGGNVYNSELVAALRSVGVAVEVHRVTGDWPGGSEDDRRKFTELVQGPGAWLVDGIVACDVPDAVVGAVARGNEITILMHMLLPDEVRATAAERRRYAASEAAALAAATGVICTSRWTAAELSRRYGRTDVGIALPGVHAAPLSPGSGPASPRLLALATITALKDQVTLVRALARLADLTWTAHLVGSDAVEPSYVAQVRAEIAEAGLQDRVRITGAVTGPRLEREWDAADLLVLTSRAETYGLVVVEALARGIASVVPAGTGAVEAQMAGSAASDRPDTPDRPGQSVPPGDSEALAEVLRTWLSDPACRRRWREVAIERRSRLADWRQTGQAVRDYLLREDWKP